VVGPLATARRVMPDHVTANMGTRWRSPYRPLQTPMPPMSVQSPRAAPVCCTGHNPLAVAPVVHASRPGARASGRRVGRAPRHAAPCQACKRPLPGRSPVCRPVQSACT
jgi:hypothetical protein